MGLERFCASNSVDGRGDGSGGVAGCDGAFLLQSVHPSLVSLQHPWPVDDSSCTWFHRGSPLMGGIKVP